MPEITVCLSFDFDAMSSWIYAYRTKSPNALSRGEFGKVGARRLLRLLDEYDLPSTWFVPGHTAEAFPKIVEELVAGGHEIGHHGYCHEDASRLEPEEEAEVFEKGRAIIERISGSSPIGHRSPSGSFGERTLDLLLDNGFVYDSSMMADDFTPYYCRKGDQAPVDSPYVFGEEIELLQIPFCWHLDDHPFFEHIRSRRGILPGLADPDRVFQVWKGDFDYLYTKMEEGVFTLTMHPQVIGRGHRLLMLERLIGEIREQPGVRFSTLGEFATQWKRQHPFGG